MHGIHLLGRLYIELSERESLYVYDSEEVRLLVMMDW